MAVRRASCPRRIRSRPSRSRSSTITSAREPPRPAPRLPGPQHRRRPQCVGREVLGPFLQALRLPMADLVDRQVGRSRVTGCRDATRSGRVWPVRRSSSSAVPPAIQFGHELAVQAGQPSCGRGSRTRSTRTISAAVSVTDVPPDAASTAIPYAGSAAAGSSTGTPRTSARS